MCAAWASRAALGPAHPTERWCPSPGPPAGPSSIKSGRPHGGGDVPRVRAASPVPGPSRRLLSAQIAEHRAVRESLADALESAVAGRRAAEAEAGRLRDQLREQHHAAGQEAEQLRALNRAAEEEVGRLRNLHRAAEAEA